jgi:hypothetical protein
LFAVYIDVLPHALKLSGIGCSVSKQYFGCLLYADDILLLSQSVFAMQKMLNICSDIINKLDLKFNVKKSMVTRIGPRWNSKCASLVLDMQNILYVPELKYLGVYITQGLQFSCSVIQCKANFYRCFNSIYSKCHYASSELICVNFLKAFCLPLILYACEATAPCAKNCAVFDKLIDRAIGKIFKTYDVDTANDIRKFMELDSMQHVIINRRRKFLVKYFAKPLPFAFCIFHMCYFTDVYPLFV